MDELDYAVWRSNYGDSASARAAAMAAGARQSVPEPSSLAAALWAAFLVTIRRERETRIQTGTKSILN